MTEHTTTTTTIALPDTIDSSHVDVDLAVLRHARVFPLSINTAHPAATGGVLLRVGTKRRPVSERERHQAAERLVEAGYLTREPGNAGYTRYLVTDGGRAAAREPDDQLTVDRAAQRLRPEGVDAARARPPR